MTEITGRLSDSFLGAALLELDTNTWCPLRKHLKSYT